MRGSRFTCHESYLLYFIIYLKKKCRALICPVSYIFGENNRSICQSEIFKAILRLFAYQPKSSNNKDIDFMMIIINLAQNFIFLIFTESNTENKARPNHTKTNYNLKIQPTSNANKIKSMHICSASHDLNKQYRISRVLNRFFFIQMITEQNKSQP